MIDDQRLKKELERLTSGPSQYDLPGGMGTVRFLARRQGNVAEVLGLAKAVLKTVDENSLAEWPSDEAWSHLLPQWFVDRFAPEQSRDEAEAWLSWWRTLPPEEQERAERDSPWTLSNWIYWMNPSQRSWYWWDGEVINSHTIRVAIEVDGWPFPWGSFAWLLKASGADAVSSEL